MPISVTKRNPGNAVKGFISPDSMREAAPDGLALRERILREAERALAREGFFGVSLRKVASSAGVHPATIGTLFGGKRGLLKAALDRRNGVAGNEP